MTKKEAKEICLNKWQWIIDNNGSTEGLLATMPELNKFYPSSCAYCHIYSDTIDDEFDECALCPIRLKTNDIDDDNDCCGCDNDNHPWMIWHWNKTKENAQKVYDLIKKS